ncbi:MAG: PEGA domain-containing protein [Myxococcaceae bacterium]
MFLTALLSLPAVASGRTLVLASGDCRDFDLLDVTGSLTNELSSRLGPDALDPKLVLEKLRPQPTSTAEAVRHALDTAQTQFFDGKFQPALEGARAAQREIERLPPSNETFKLLALSWALEGVTLRALNDKAGSDEVWKRLLSLDKDFSLDRDLYPPTTLKQFDQVRKEAGRISRVELSVRSPTPGAEVLVDGKPMGKTPLKVQLPAGSYWVTLANGDLRSFSHEVQVAKAAEVQIDLAFESAVQTRRPLCVTAEQKNAIDQGMKLAALAGAEQAMVVRNESPSGEAGFISVTVVEVNKGNTSRVGGMKMQQAHTPQGVSSLADFLVTGKYVPPVVAYDGSKPIETAAAPAPASSTAASSAVSAPPEATVTASGGTPGARLLSYGLIGVGGAALITGLVVYATGGSDRSELSKLIDSNGNLPAKGTMGYDRSLQLLSSNDTNLNLTLGLCIGGGVVAIAGAALFLLFPSDSDVHATVSFGRGGAMAGFSYRF